VDVIEVGSIFATGLFAWTFTEYLIHGWLSHILATVVGRLHAVHHRDPHAVFTVRAWAPLAIIWIILATSVGWSPGTIFFAGMTTGFVAYEVLHYRIHFSDSSGAFETSLRERHMIHHRRDPRRCLGVTSPLWDLIFGTEPLTGMDRLRGSVSGTPPLSGRTNVRLRNFWPFRRPA
jgi:sterol desaturase/sphingolipid hydroxylase (fatty acid hydroxylase superfamily)